MPFTFSHPAVVLPLNRLGKNWISLTALVIGSLTPDFEYFIRMKVFSIYSHTWVGLFWFDLPIGLLLLIIYNRSIKNKLIDRLPQYFNQRLTGFKDERPKYLGANLIVVVICLWIGASSHIFWDSFTHPTGYFVKHSHLLSHKIVIKHFPIPFYNILQQLSSIVGALIIIYTISNLTLGKITTAKGSTAYWVKIVFVSIVILAIRFAYSLKLHDYGDVIMSEISGLLIGLLIVSVITPAQQPQLISASPDSTH
ncbi:MAG: DUF4184 family protein [Bacteroidetes bacterium]|jgi:type III secretory pathway component EscS|nr:DUF4184 family protein [Bacteroidota bacterium]